jgi:hypothetical protein
MLNRNWYRDILYKSIWEKIMTIPYSLIPYAFIPLYLFPTPALFAQPKTNLELFYELVDSSVIEFSGKIPGSYNNIKLELNLGEIYSVFNNRIVAKVHSTNKNIIKDNNKNIPSVNYVIDEVKVEYGETFRDGFFGDFYIPRNLYLKGNYLIVSDTTLVNNFYYSLNDTIKFDEITQVENGSYPFTKGNPPAEPFFSGLLEPIIALSTTALAIILFFTIRSK